VPCFLFADSNIRADLVSGWKRRLKYFILPRILRIAAGVLCCGRLGEEYFGRYGVPSNLLFRFPYEPDYERLTSVTGIEIEVARGTYGLSRNRRYLIYSGRLAPVKRVDLLLAAFDRISPLRPQWDLIIAGGGDERASLERWVSERIATRVIWTGFINEPQSLRSLYAAANVLVLPSDYEPWGVVVTEAAVLMPVVASSAVGAAADVIIDGENGFIFEAGDVESLQQCLLQVTDERTLETMTKAAPVRFAEWHDRSDPVKGLRAALQSVGIDP
jgi:glycosyltransferase involved in cell wall biosynthesis